VMPVIAFSERRPARASTPGKSADKVVTTFDHL
jgi:hypothetical protein